MGVSCDSSWRKSNRVRSVLEIVGQMRAKDASSSCFEALFGLQFVILVTHQEVMEIQGLLEVSNRYEVFVIFCLVDVAHELEFCKVKSIK